MSASVDVHSRDKYTTYIDTQLYNEQKSDMWEYIKLTNKICSKDDNKAKRGYRVEKTKG